MPRQARIVIPDVPMHLVQRGNRRQQTFFSSDDYALYRGLMAQSFRRYDIECLAYCLMPNHTHHVVVCHSDQLSTAVGEAHHHYSALINKREGWRGHLWQDRYRSFVMDEEHAWRCVRYVELNPVASGLALTAWDWPWSSARAHLLGVDDELVRGAVLQQRFGDWATYLSQPVTNEELAAFKKHTSTGRPLGQEPFVRSIEKTIGRVLLAPGRRMAVGPG